MAKILVTGATGFIGKRLIYSLLEQGHEVYGLGRIRGVSLCVSSNKNFHLLYGDLRNPKTIDPFPEEIDAAYYLVHGLGSSHSNLVEHEEEVAHHFLSALEKTRCKQIIFLGGIIEDENTLSPHLLSRLATENVLRKSKIPCTILRSSIIIGSGSASFEIIRDLVEKLPLMIAPRWVQSKCQPISIRDVLFYLSRVLLFPSAFGNVYDIGGPEVLSFKEVLLRYARFRKLKVFIFDVPLLTPKLSSYWLVLITRVRFSICRYLVESMKQNTRKLNQTIDLIVAHRCLSYEQSLALAFQRISQNEVVSTWMDAWDLQEVGANIEEFIQVPNEGCLKDIKEEPIEIDPKEVIERIWDLGGERGWYSMNWAWKLRGFMDRCVGGTGLNRGRRDPHRLEVGESIDFWRVVVANEKEGHLILYAEMKLPGEAWLEFKVEKALGLLRQTATFRPRGFLGRIYWYLCLPFHLVIFKNMAKGLTRKG